MQVFDETLQMELIEKEHRRERPSMCYDSLRFKRLWASSCNRCFGSNEKAIKLSNIETNDRKLAYARINSPEGQDYLKAMAAAANFA